MKATYIGAPANPAEQKQLPDEFPMFGVTFERGKFVEVPDDVAAKVAGNSHFETQGKEPAAPPAVPEA